MAAKKAKAKKKVEAAPKSRRKNYSDAEKAQHLITLYATKYNYKRAAILTGVSEKTLRRWDKAAPKKGLGVYELLEHALQLVLMTAPTTLAGQDWAITVGILLDKWLLAQGMATERKESIFKHLEDLEDEEIDELVEQFTKAAGAGRSKG